MTTTYTFADDPARPVRLPRSASRVRSAASQPGELCEDFVRGRIGPAARPHVYRIRVAAEMSQ